MSKVKDRILKTPREKQCVVYKETPMRIYADLSPETLQGRRECHSIFKVIKGKNLQPRLLCSVEGDTEFYRKAKAKSSAPVNQFYKKC